MECGEGEAEGKSEVKRKRGENMAGNLKGTGES